MAKIRPKLLQKQHVKRVLFGLRHEGLRTTLRKSIAYTARLYGGAGLSAVQPTAPSGPQTAYLAPMWAELASKEALHMPAAPATRTRARKIALIGDLNLPQCRKYRVEQMVELWAAQGVALDYAHYEDIPRATTLMQSATHLMFYRTQSSDLNSMYLYEARRLRLPVLYDLDDPLFSVQAYETYGNMAALDPGMKAHFLREAPRYLDAMNMADILSFSTPALCAHARSLSPRPVHLRRNFADTATLKAGADALKITDLDTESEAHFTLAFASGSQGHEVDFAEIATDVTAFLAADPSRRLMVLGHVDRSLLPTEIQDQITAHPFRDYATYLRTLARADAAVMPLADDLFNRCKSGVRVLDAAAVNVPSVVGHVGDLHTLVRDGETGLIVPEGASWHPALEQLAHDRKATAAMGHAARQTLETHWSASSAPHLIDPEILAWVKD